MTQSKRRTTRRAEARVSRAKRQLLRRLQRSRTSARWSTGMAACAYAITLTEPRSALSAFVGATLILTLASMLLIPDSKHVGRATAKAPAKPRPRRRA